MKITIALANYNHSAYLAQCIGGMRAQTHQDWDLVIHDDGSRDNSRDIIEGLAAQDSRIVPSFFPTNRGAFTAIQTVTMEACARAASGDLFMSVAADDYISNPRFFERAVEAIKRFPEAAGVFSRATLVDGTTGRPFWRLGHYGWNIPFAHGGTTRFIPPGKAMAAFLRDRLFVPGASVIWRKPLFAGLGGYEEALGPQSDFFLNHALAAQHGIVFIDQACVTIREFRTSYSGSSSDEDYFRFHALMERRLRDLDLPVAANPRLFARWRASVIGKRIRDAAQRRRVAAILRLCRSLPDRERRSSPPGFQAFLTQIESEGIAMEDRLAARPRLAHDIFDELAGRLTPEPTAPRANLHGSKPSQAATIRDSGAEG